MKLDSFYQDTELGVFKLLGFTEGNLAVDRYHYLPFGQGWTKEGFSVIDKGKFLSRLKRGLTKHRLPPA